MGVALIQHGTESDGYRFLGHLGSGSMGEVYLARQLRLDRLVAVKVLSNKRSNQGAKPEQLLAEARAAAALNHPNIIAIHDVRSAAIDGQQRHFVVMEYVDGEELQHILDREGRLREDQFRRVLRGVIDALTYAAMAGFTHRDVKPGNIMLSHDGQIKLADFGLAVRSGTHLDGDVIGTPKYMAPEQARGQRVDHRTDQYALGCIIYQLLTGLAPFDDEDPYQLIRLHKHAPIPLAHELVRCDRRWSDLAARLMSKAMDQRFDDPRALQQEVHALCADQASLGAVQSRSSRRTLRRRQRRSVQRRVAAARAAPSKANRVVTRLPNEPASAPDWPSAAPVEDQGPGWRERLADAISDSSIALWDWFRALFIWLMGAAGWLLQVCWALVLWCLPYMRRALERALPPVADVYLVLVAWTWQVRVVRGYEHVLSGLDDDHAMIAGVSRGRHLPMVWWLAQHPEVSPRQRLYGRWWWGMVLRHLRLMFRLRGSSPAQRRRQAAALYGHWRGMTERGASWSCPLDRRQFGCLDADVLAAACAGQSRIFPIGVGAQPAWLYRSSPQRSLIPAPWAQVVIAVGAPVPLSPQGDRQLLTVIIEQELQEMQHLVDAMTHEAD